MEETLIIGVDIGGTHITAAQIDPHSRRVRRESLVRQPVNAHDGVDMIIDNWAKAITESIVGFPGKDVRLGIAMPGPFDYERGISLMQGQDKYDALYGKNIKDLLARQLKLQPDYIRMANDAASFLQGEVLAGVAMGCTHVMGLTLGTGLGSARYYAGKAEDADLWNSPFKESIAEDYLSSRWFVKRYREINGQAIAGVKELAYRAPEDKQVQQLFEEFGRNLAGFLLPLIRQHKPEMLVLGGSMAQASPLFAASLNMGLQESGQKLKWEVAQLGEVAALIGAAGCWLDPQPEIS